MSDESAADIRQQRRDWMARHRETYLRTGGVQGHVMDISEVGGHAFTTHCLIRVRGRKSGRTQIVPLIYGDQLYVLGDNSAESSDSRQFGAVNRAYVIARVIWPRA